MVVRISRANDLHGTANKGQYTLCYVTPLWLKNKMLLQQYQTYRIELLPHCMTLIEYNNNKKK